MLHAACLFVPLAGMDGNRAHEIIDDARLMLVTVSCQRHGMSRNKQGDRGRSG